MQVSPGWLYCPQYPGYLIVNFRPLETPYLACCSGLYKIWLAYTWKPKFNAKCWLSCSFEKLFASWPKVWSISLFTIYIQSFDIWKFQFMQLYCSRTQNTLGDWNTFFKSLHFIFSFMAILCHVTRLLNMKISAFYCNRFLPAGWKPVLGKQRRESLTRPSFFLYFWEIRQKRIHWPGSQPALRLYNSYNLCPCARPAHVG